MKLESSTTTLIIAVSNKISYRP